MMEIWRGHAPDDMAARQPELFERFRFGALVPLQRLHGAIGHSLRWFDVELEPDALELFAATVPRTPLA